MDGKFCIYKIHIPEVDLVHDLQFTHNTSQTALCSLEVIALLPFFPSGKPYSLVFLLFSIKFI